MQLEHYPTLRGHLMGQSSSFGQWGGQARRAARCGSPESQMAGKRRNAADEPLWPPSSNLAEGRVLLPRSNDPVRSDNALAFNKSICCGRPH